MFAIVMILLQIILVPALIVDIVKQKVDKQARIDHERQKKAFKTR